MFPFSDFAIALSWNAVEWTFKRNLPGEKRSETIHQQKNTSDKSEVFFQAGDGIRTRECQLGRLMPYHLATPAMPYYFTLLPPFGQ